MQKSQHRNIRNMKNQGNMTSAKVHNSLATDCKDMEMDEMLDREFKRMGF
jgi:hypothetical protein